MGLFQSIAKVAATVSKVPALKVSGGGVAIAFPKSALNLSAVTSAGKVIDAAQGIIGTPAQQASAKRVVAHTIKRAKAGDPEAKNGVKAMETAQKAKALAAVRTGQVPKARPVVNTTGTPQGGWHINRQGQIRVLA